MSFKQIVVRAGACQHEDKLLFQPQVEQHPIRRDVAVAETFLVAAQRMVAALRRQTAALRKQSDHFVKFAAACAVPAEASSAAEKQYSRSLGKKEGVELFRIGRRLCAELYFIKNK